MNKTITDLEIEDIIKLGINAGINYIKQQEELKTGKRTDKKLRNTKLLLKIYRTLKAHIDIADKTLNSLDEEELLNVIDEIDFDLNEENLVHSIVISQKRTALLVKHLDMCLEYLKYKSESIRKPGIYQIVYALYIKDYGNDIIPTYEQICEDLHISQSTLSRNLNSALLELSVLNFGIDSIKL